MRAAGPGAGAGARAGAGLARGQPRTAFGGPRAHETTRFVSVFGASTLIVFGVLTLGACHEANATRSAVVPIGTVHAPPLHVLPTPASQPTQPPFCADEAFRAARVLEAWPEGDRILFCAETKAEESDVAFPRVCASVDKAGRYSLEGDVHGTAPPLPMVPLRNESADGKLTFRLEGGLREPKGAKGVLEQKGPRRVLKRARIDYDEHIAFDGWIGQAIVYRTWVDEGPGCTLTMIDPRKGWPPGGDDDSVGLGGCYGTSYTLMPRAGEYAFVDSGGSSITFVNEKSLAVTTVETERQAGPEMGTTLVAWVEGHDLVLVYGAPILGDVARVSLTERKLTAAFAPNACEANVKKPK